MRIMLMIILILITALIYTTNENEKLRQCAATAEAKLAAYKYEDYRNDEDY
jgi:hypothetical protein